MIDREKFVWRCVLAAPETGATSEVEFSSYWSPKREWITGEFIARSAAAEAFMGSGKKQVFLGVSAELVA